MDLESVDELLTTTRAVRKRLDLTRPVGRDVILECLRLAMQAPTSSNAQDWRWLVITDADKRAAIAEIYRSIGENICAARRIGHVRPADPAGASAARSASPRRSARSRCMSSHVWNAVRRQRLAVRRVGVGVDHPGRLELPARSSVPRPRIGVDDNASGQGARRSPNCWESRTPSPRPRCSRWPTRSAPTSGRPRGRRRRP